MASVLVLDSGIGGLSVLREIRLLLACELVYVADKAFFPYGNKSPHILFKLVASLIDLALLKYQEWGKAPPDAVVIACNTASTRVLDQLRQRYGFPIVGVVPAIKPAGLVSATGVIGVLATPNTVQSPYLEDLRSTHVPHVQLIAHGSMALVELAELQFWDGAACDFNEVMQAVAPLFETPQSHEIDVIVLACTHFPMLRPRIEAVLLQLAQRKIAVLDSGKAVARQVLRVLGDKVSVHSVPAQHVSFLAPFIVLARVQVEGNLVPIKIRQEWL